MKSGDITVTSLKWCHMSVTHMVFEITVKLTVCSTACWSSQKEISTSSALLTLCKGNPLMGPSVIDGFYSQKVINVESIHVMSSCWDFICEVYAVTLMLHHMTLVMHHMTLVLHHMTLVMHHMTLVLHHMALMLHHMTLVLHHMALMLHHMTLVLHHMTLVMHHMS